MRKLSTTEKSRMTATQVESLNDSCTLYAPNVTSQDSLGEQSSTWTTYSDIACGFNPNPSPKTYNGQIVELQWDATLRLPLTQNININWEATVRNVRYKVYGIVQGNGVQIIPLKLAAVND